MTASFLPTSYNPEDPATQARAAHNRALKDELWAKVAKAALGGARTNEIRRTLIGRELIGAGA